MVNLEELSKADLIKMVNMYAKNWLAHDGCWFLAIEEQEGIEKAIEYDEASWERFTRVEARRIMKEFGIGKGSGIEGLKKALSYRLYATLNKDAFEEVDGKFIYKMVSCRVQSARERKGLAHFPCKTVGVIEYGGFAETIDPNIRTRCIACPPDDIERDYHCAWEFTMVNET